jgi:hypothetical protein
MDLAIGGWGAGGVWWVRKAGPTTVQSAGTRCFEPWPILRARAIGDVLTGGRPRAAMWSLWLAPVSGHGSSCDLSPLIPSEQRVRVSGAPSALTI